MTRRVLETVTRIAEPHEDCRTKEQMTEICCEDAPAVPCCERVEVWTGYTDDEIKEKLGLNLDDQGRDDQGRYVDIRRPPRSQPCGEKVTRYDVTPNNCCTEVELLGIDLEHSATVISDNHFGLIVTTGGTSPLRVSVRGNGFFLDYEHTIRDGVVSGGSFLVYTGEACGAAKITITDGCSTTNHIVRAANGYWVPMDDPPIGTCLGDGPADDRWVHTKSWAAVWWHDLIVGDTLQKQESNYQYCDEFDFPWCIPCGEWGCAADSDQDCIWADQWYKWVC